MSRSAWQARLDAELVKVYEEFSPERAQAPETEEDVFRLIVGAQPKPGEPGGPTRTAAGGPDVALRFIKGATRGQRTRIREMLA